MNRSIRGLLFSCAFGLLLASDPGTAADRDGLPVPAAADASLDGDARPADSPALTSAGGAVGVPAEQRTPSLRTAGVSGARNRSSPQSTRAPLGLAAATARQLGIDCLNFAADDAAARAGSLSYHTDTPPPSLV
ncbi:MAG: hypothetical protein ACRELD_02545 [Longimicrobiales bacterium]